MFGINGSASQFPSFSQPSEGGHWIKQGVIAAAISAITLVTANVVERTNPRGAFLIRVALGGVALLWLFSKIFPSSRNGGSNQSFGARLPRRDVLGSSSPFPYDRASARPAPHYVPRQSFGGRSPSTTWNPPIVSSSASQGGGRFPHVIPAAATTRSGLGDGSAHLNPVPQSRGVERGRAGDFPTVAPVTARISSSLRGSPGLNPVPPNRGVAGSRAGDFPAVAPVTARTSSSLRGSQGLNPVPQSRGGDTHIGVGSRQRGGLTSVPQSRR